MEKNVRNAFQDLRQRHLYVSHLGFVHIKTDASHVASDYITTNRLARDRIEERLGLVITIQGLQIRTCQDHFGSEGMDHGSIVSSLNVSFIVSICFLRQIAMQYLSGIKVKFPFAQCSPRGACLSSIQLFKAIVGSCQIKLLQDNRSTICRFPSTSPPDPQAHRGTPTLGGGVFLWNKIANLAGLNRKTME